jgi:hypothetical protein
MARKKKSPAKKTGKKVALGFPGLPDVKKKKKPNGDTKPKTTSKRRVT